jgi:hypothetical protein
MRLFVHSLALLHRLPDESFQTKNMRLPTGRAAMFGGFFARNDYVKMLPAPVAVNHHRNREVPFQERVIRGVGSQSSSTPGARTS